ncbi:MAG: ANTAR domain-containing protein [Dorea sp.]|nr:ANTAR domain-containing protein [Dorea sp.]
MVGVIVVFPKRENAVKIRNLLAHGGVDVSGVCTTGAQAIQMADMYDEGIVISGYRLSDMNFFKLREDVPDQFDMILIASGDKCDGDLPRGVVGLPMPIKVFELLNTVNLMLEAMYRKRRKRQREKKKRDSGQQEVIREAKLLLMERNQMSEAEAHRYIQKSSMDNGTNMVETAQMILTMMK